MTNQILTREQLAEVLGMSVEQIRRLTRDGLIPHHRIGAATYRYYLPDVLSATRVTKHPDDEAVDRFSLAMHARMAECRARGKAGWEECVTDSLWTLLRESVEKGDTVDVGNYAMMIFNRGSLAE